MKFLGWLIYWVIGSVVLYGICGFTEDYDLIVNWPSLTKAILIVGSIGWGAYLAYWVNKED